MVESERGKEGRASLVDATPAPDDGTILGASGGTKVDIKSVFNGVDISMALNRLSQIENLGKFFEALREESFNLLEKMILENSELKEILDDLTMETDIPADELNANVFGALKENDFDEFIYPKESSEYQLLLELGSAKNQLVQMIGEEAIKENGDRLGLSEDEKMVLNSYMKMMIPVDEIFMKWRTDLYPAKFKADEKQLEEDGLDDPYAVVQEKDGGYVSVPYSAAFENDYKRLIEYIDELLQGLEVSEDSTGNLDRAKFAAYLNAYKAALSCTESKKDDSGEWESVKLWKEVDRRWVECQDRVQVIHGIEHGYDAVVDPYDCKIIPELKISVQTVRPGVAELVSKMKTENAEGLSALCEKKLGDKAVKAKETINILPKSHVGLITVVSGGGNSTDLLGSAQMAPNYEDVRLDSGVKAFMSAKDEGAELRREIAKAVFSDDGWGKEMPPELAGHYQADFLGGHELGHVLIGDLTKIDEIKATWTGLTAIKKRVENGVLSPEVAEMAMKEHVKYCLKYLLAGAEDDSGREGRVNIKLFLKHGLIVRGEDGKYSFDAGKIDSVYEEIEKLWVEFMDKCTTGNGPKSKSYYAWRRDVFDLSGVKEEIKELKSLAESARP
ncbi:MAG: hypothetical protein V1679_01485 [Candidatus Peregrinibacteria bacterium]